MMLHVDRVRARRPPARLLRNVRRLVPLSSCYRGRNELCQLGQIRALLERREELNDPIRRRLVDARAHYVPELVLDLRGFERMLRAAAPVQQQLLELAAIACAHLDSCCMPERR